MTNNSASPVSNFGVYYASKDYAGFWKRVFAWCIDIIVVLSLLGLYAIIISLIAEWSEFEAKLLFWLSLLTCHLYLVVLKTQINQHSVFG